MKERTKEQERIIKYLERAHQADRWVERLEQRLENLRMLTTDTANHLSGTMGGGSKERQKTLELLAEIDEMERAIEEAKAEAQETRTEVGMTICKISDPFLQKILMMRYLEHLTWREIAEKMKCSHSLIYKYWTEGFEELGKYIP